MFPWTCAVFIFPVSLLANDGALHSVGVDNA